MKDSKIKYQFTTLEEHEIQERIHWFINLRWLAIIGVSAVIAFFELVLKIKLPVIHLFSILLTLVLCNTIYIYYSKSIEKKKANPSNITYSIRFSNIQITVDLLLLALLVHFFGGVESPIYFYFIFHMVIASILLSPKFAYYQATLAISLFLTIVSLEYFKIIPHYQIDKFTIAPLYDNLLYCCMNFFVFSTTMYLAVYIATSITSKLRKKQREVIILKNELEQTNTELKETQATLIHAEKMTSLGQIAASVAHEVNNPLAGVLIYIRLLLKNITEKKNVDEDVFKDRLKTMEKEIERSSRIIKNLLDFSRHQELLMRPCMITEKIENTLILLGNQAKLNTVGVIKKYDSIPLIFADPDQLQQVFVNIVLNAIQAMPTGGILTISTKYNDGDDTVELCFSDTGCGIKEENMKKLFTPFFTTKGKSEGIGLGLAVCNNIITRHNGEIFVESEKGKGTTFKIRFNAYHSENETKTKL